MEGGRGGERGRERQGEGKRVRGECLGWADLWVGCVNFLWLGQFSRGKSEMAPNASYEGGVPVIVNVYKQ